MSADETVPEGTEGLRVTVMSPADIRNARAKAWRKCWAGVTPGKNEQKLQEAVPPSDLTDPIAVLLAMQRIVAWGNCAGMNHASVVFALESLLQRVGFPQEPPCCMCEGTGFTVGLVREHGVKARRPCPEGCRCPWAPS